MSFIIGASNKANSLIIKSCDEIVARYPGLLRYAVIAVVHLPAALRQLDRRFFGNKLGAYAMCLNHWLKFLPFPVILINAEWLGDDANLWHRYRLDVARNYHPECGCPVRYIIGHEFAHFIYVNLPPEDRRQWVQLFEHRNPTGYSTNPEECYCEAFSGHMAGLAGRYYDDAPRFAAKYSNL